MTDLEPDKEEQVEEATGMFADAVEVLAGPVSNARRRIGDSRSTAALVVCIAAFVAGAIWLSLTWQLRSARLEQAENWAQQSAYGVEKDALRALEMRTKMEDEGTDTSGVPKVGDG